MENIPDVTKRKKRRTRKCLDELRNRSRRMIIGNSFEQSSQQLAKACVLGSKKNNVLITTDRLSLKYMFPNAIRSETVTRPTIACTKKEQRLNLDNHKAATEVQNTGSNTASLSDFDENDQRTNGDIHRDVDPKSSSSFVQFSPTGPAHGALPLDKDATSSLESPSSQTLQTDYSHHLYEDLMNEIPAYFRQFSTRSNSRRNVIENTFNTLQKLYEESCRKEYEERIEVCLNGVTKASETSSSDELPRGRASPAAAPRSSPAVSDDAGPAATPAHRYYPHPLK